MTLYKPTRQSASSDVVRDKSRLVYIKIFLLISLAGYVLAWCNSAFISKSLTMTTTLFIICLAIFSSSAFIVVSVYKKSLFGRLVLHFSLFAIVIYSILFTQYGLYWLFVGPVIIILIESQTVAFVLFGIYISTMILIQFQPFIPSQYSNQSVVTSTVSILLIAIYLFLYKRKYDQNTIEIFEKEQQLEELSKHLSDDVAEKTKRQEELALSMAELSRHNQVLSDNRIALTNVLEDEKELRHELELAKKDIEHKVEQRTAQLREEHARLHATVQSLPVGMVMFDEELKQVHCNRAIKQIIREIVDDNTTLTIDNFLFNRLRIKKQIESCLDQKKSTLISQLDHDGKVLRIYIAPIVLEKDDQKAGVVIILEDITEEKVMERSKEEFLSIASHELRTPLTAIRGNAKLLDKVYRDRVNDPIFNELTKDISLSSERLIGIVNDYLETSSLEQSKIIFKPEFFLIEDLIVTIIHELSSAAREKGLYLEFARHNDRRISQVYADPQRVSQVLVNLVSNGLNYTKKGGITISLSQPNADKVEVAVRDTGVGIGDRNRKLLFHKFQKADDNILTRDWKRSTGLGLYIAKLLTELMGGSIELKDSQVGEGSCFAFTLPTRSPAKK